MTKRYDLFFHDDFVYVVTKDIPNINQALLFEKREGEWKLTHLKENFGLNSDKIERLFILASNNLFHRDFFKSAELIYLEDFHNGWKDEDLILYADLKESYLRQLVRDAFKAGKYDVFEGPYTHLKDKAHIMAINTLKRIPIAVEVEIERCCLVYPEKPKGLWYMTASEALAILYERPKYLENQILITKWIFNE